MATSPVTDVGHRSGRPLLGLRRAPGRLALRVFRLPLRLYERDWGWMLGRTFVMFEHVGRSTILGWEDLNTEDSIRAFVRAHPFVAFRPVAPPPAENW